MSKLTLSLLAISFFVITLCSCTTQQRTEPNLYFSASADISTADISMTASVTSSKSGVLVELMSPDNIKGLKYHSTNSTLYIEYNGLKCTTDSEYLDTNNPIDILIDTLTSLSYTDLKYKEESDTSYVYLGTSDNGKYMLHVDKKSGSILRIKPLYAECEISFLEI